ncbi:MAG: DUF4384 domain-containing protein [Leptolyngbyaceae cyanobacterium]
MSLTRRALLQQASLALTSVSLSQMGLSLLTRRSQRVLATPTSRKLALLIGINHYPDNVFGRSPQHNPDLSGAITDVELVKELLVARFGFNRSNILVLQDKQATRSAIEAAFQEHLLGQVSHHDVVLFHCSGLGSYIQLDPETQAAFPTLGLSEIQPTFVPIDGQVNQSRNETTASDDLLLSTIALLLGALPTRQIVSLLDFGYSAPTAFLGNFRVRSRLTIPQGILPDHVFEQFEYQQSSHNSQSGDASQLSSLGAWPGLLITAADGHGVATEAPLGGFTAGLLTHSFTQRLWWETPALAVNKEIGQVVGHVEKLIGSQYRPLMTGSDITTLGASTKKFNLLSPTNTDQSAEGVICNVDTQQRHLDLWMGGLPALVLQHCLSFSYVRFLSATGIPSENWGQVRSHAGLVAKADAFVPANTQPLEHTTDPVTPGMLVHEVVRVIPQDMDLVVALGNELERIERVDATSALSSIADIRSTGTGEQQVDCIFDKIRATDSSTLPFPSAPASDRGSEAGRVGSLGSEMAMSQMYGLFHPGRNLIPGTVSPTEEAVKTAIRRVSPQFSHLLAEKWLQLTVNHGSSRLGSRVTLETVAPSARQVGQQYTARAIWNVPTFLPIAPQQEEADRPTLLVGDQIQCRLQNYSDRPLYGILLNIDSRGTLTVLHPSGTENPDESSALNGVISAQTITTVPSPSTNFPWTVSNSLGVATVYAVMSCAPFTTTMAALSKLVPSVDMMNRPQTLSSPLPIVQAIVTDLHNASQPALADLGLDIPGDRYHLSVECWATFSFTYNVATEGSLESSDNF